MLLPRVPQFKTAVGSRVLAGLAGVGGCILLIWGISKANARRKAGDIEYSFLSPSEEDPLTDK